MPGKRAARHAKQDVRRRWPLGLVAAAVVVVLAGALTFAQTRSSSGGDPTTSSTPGTPSASAGGSGTPSPQPSPSHQSSPAADAKALRACAAEVSSADKVVAAAAQGVSDWSDHVQARTDMLKGRISVSTMDSIWKRTRLAGQADQSRFHAARHGYDSTSECARLRSGSAGTGPAADCLARSKAAKDAVAAADAAMRDWKSHLANMSLYAHGQMSSMTAQDKWVSAWRDAPPHISAYRSARAALEKAPPCDVPG